MINIIVLFFGDVFPVSLNALTDHKNINCELAGVKQIKLHDFRHSCSSLSLDRMSQYYIIAKHLKYSKKEVLRTYAYLFLS